MNAGELDGQAQVALETAARRSYGKLVAFLAARTRDVAAAEDAVSEAFASAVESWPVNGCPSSPEAWLLTVARRNMINVFRKRRIGDVVTEQLQLLAERPGSAALSTTIPDDRLTLLFACAHPAIDVTVRAPLMLQAVLGLDAARIASAFLISPAAMAQRLVRAKNKIREAGIPFRIPEREELSERLGAVLDAIYAAFAEGWIDAARTDAGRSDLAEEAIFLGRLLIELLPGEAEALGLLALMIHAESRRRARRDEAGDYVPLTQQDPALWDSQMIEEAEALLLRASALGSIGRYQLEGALQSAHIHRRRTGRSNWEEIIQLYDALWKLSGSPVVAINRAVAIAEVHGAQVGLEAIEEVAADTRVNQYEPYWAARAELFAKAGKTAEARTAYEIAIGLERDSAVRRFLQQRQSALGI